MELDTSRPFLAPGIMGGIVKGNDGWDIVALVVQSEPRPCFELTIEGIPGQVIWPILALAAFLVWKLGWAITAWRKGWREVAA